MAGQQRRIPALLSPDRGSRARALRGPRILVVHNSAGGGHRSVAEAIREGFETLYGDRIRVKRVDPFRYSRVSLAARLIACYPEQLVHHSALWGSVFYGLDQPLALSLALPLA